MPMKMNRTLAYSLACLAKLETLGRHQDWIRVSELAKEEALPVAYLNKVLRTLVHHGIVESSRGRGYRLAKSLENISVWELMEAVTFNGAPEKRKADGSHKLYFKLRSQVSRWLDGLTLAEIVESANGHSSNGDGEGDR